MKLNARHTPDFYIRLIIVILIALAMLSFFAPFLRLSLNPSQDDFAAIIRQYLLQAISGEEIKPRYMTGFQMIFAFLSDETIHKNINIGPFPCNFYVLFAFLFGGAAILFTLWPRTGRRRDLVAAILSALSFAFLLVARLRFRGYYVAHTQNGGEALGNLLDAEILTVSMEPMMAVSMGLFFIAGMISVLLYAQMMYDPFFVKAKK